MNLYQSQHPFYCGIGLHAKQMYACVVDQAGKKLLHRNFKTRQADKSFEQIKPFGPGIAIGCESTFNWYWLADACRDNGLSFILGHALYLKAIYGGKVKNDKIDSEKLARLLRGSHFAVSYAFGQAAVQNSHRFGRAIRAFVLSTRLAERLSKDSLLRVHKPQLPVEVPVGANAGLLLSGLVLVDEAESVDRSSDSSTGSLQSVRKSNALDRNY